MFEKFEVRVISHRKSEAFFRTQLNTQPLKLHQLYPAPQTQTMSQEFGNLSAVKIKNKNPSQIQITAEQVPYSNLDPERS
jgi:hypothetical protein